MRQVKLTDCGDARFYMVARSTKNCRVQPVAGGESFLVPTPTVIDCHVPDMVQAVKDHALQNYEQDGWDVIVETYSTDQLAKLVRECKDAPAAIRLMHKIAKTHAERQSELESTAY